METETRDLINEVRIAYADAGDQRGAGDFVDTQRCLSFLTSGWLDEEDAVAAVHRIGGYNRFDPCTVGRILAAITDTDPTARFAIGREGSPAVYAEVDPEAAGAVREVFASDWQDDADGDVFAPGGPDELSIVQPTAVGSARKYEEQDYDLEAHSMCQHDRPPVDQDDYAPVSGDRAYVRAWWD